MCGMCGECVCVLEKKVVVKDHILRGTGTVLIACSNIRMRQKGQ